MASNIVFDSETKTLTCTIDSQPWVYSLHQEGNWSFVELRTPIRVAEPSAEILASSVPPHVTYEEFFALFLQCGIIHAAKLEMCESGLFSGQALVEFCSVKACRKAVALLDKEKIKEHCIDVRIAPNMHRLVLNGVPQHIDKKVLLKVIRRKLGHDFEWLTKSFTASIQHNNWCIKFSTSQAAADAFLAAAPFFEVEGKLVEVQWAAYDMDRHVRILYFGNLNTAVTKRVFFDILDDNIDVRTMVQYVMEHCGGFITFVNKVAMKEAILKLTDLRIGNNILRVSEAPLDMNDHHSVYLDDPTMDSPALLIIGNPNTSTTTSNSATRTSSLPPFSSFVGIRPFAVIPPSPRLIRLTDMNGMFWNPPSLTSTTWSQRTVATARVPTAAVAPWYYQPLNYSFMEGRTQPGCFCFRSVRTWDQCPYRHGSFNNVDMNMDEAFILQPPPGFNRRNPDSA